MAYFGKEYTFSKEENYDAFIKSLGLGADEAQTFLNYKPNHKFEKTGDGYKFVFVLPSGNKEVSFKIGETFDDVIREGLQAKAIVTQDGDTFTHVQDFGDRGTITFKREYTADTLKVTVTNSKWDGAAIRWYTAV